MKILIVEDDLPLLEAIKEIFENESFDTTGTSTGDEGYFLAEQGSYDLILLDVMLPGMNGLEIVKRLRAHQVSTPIIMLTAKDSVEDCVKGLDAGADDYVTKPFAVTVLLARVRSVLRRRGSVDLDGKISCGPIQLVSSLRDAYVDEQPLKLSPKEYELLEFFLCNKEQILSRDQIFERIWGFDSESASTAVDVYVHLLRKKLAPYGGDLYLKTIRGVGYLFKGDSNVQ
ncbi:response regulator transcription factor [Paenibacillus alginolyticus]|uniref:Response regulator transcription factor n=1 Tax=Paenibacillus alginolyticus TaxID=59839 RepID=A0ABT4GPP5_9BACL|nr:response regulator transcription factor [Paenibacillus alginolyticus]MCY9670336.1 response regulator transcription factor [Paenibacillus alginolyticus]MCY9698189.1 response regulator transcription factor [Paenibacillus alginolyticus]MEC0148524.1 response regulator transcription factor [Paenibacillus alginolyticus]